jgi:signal transduction histidine kinase
MQPISQAAVWDGSERRRVEAVVETLANLQCAGESLAAVAHDARNMVTALGLYCDLLEEPGVLAPAYVHYGGELRLLAAASRRLVEKLVTLDAEHSTGHDTGGDGERDPVQAASRAAQLSPVRRPVKGETGDRFRQSGRWELLPAVQIDNLAAELLANRNLLAALAGPSVALTVDTESGALPVRLTGEDLTRVLVNLVKNAAEAMPAGGKIVLSLREQPEAPDRTAPLDRTAPPDRSERLLLSIDDSGPGIPAESLDCIFDAGFTTQAAWGGEGGWPAARRGLGLSITRSIVDAAGGQIRALNRCPRGARIEIELPVRRR